MNPLNEEAFELGRKLFYEKRLSIDNTTSCGTCHEQRASFTTYDHDLSHGANSSHTKRNAPVLLNLAWSSRFFHDGSEKDLESVIISHITSPVDMDETMQHVIEKLSGDADYRALFQKAYGSTDITERRITDALKQFVLNLVAADSKYDRVKKGETAFTINEQSGYNIFKSKCASCHTEPLFTDHSFRNIGLPLNSFLNDFGRMEVTGNPSDSLKFKTPTLRNIHMSSYYTHDGRFNTYRAVIRHYRMSVQPSATLDPLLTGGIPLTNAEEDDLVLFLQTLTDTSFMNNPRFR